MFGINSTVEYSSNILTKWSTYPPQHRPWHFVFCLPLLFFILLLRLTMSMLHIVGTDECIVCAVSVYV